jgi:hypothetical protein
MHVASFFRPDDRKFRPLKMSSVMLAHINEKLRVKQQRSTLDFRGQVKTQ